MNVRKPAMRSPSTATHEGDAPNGPLCFHSKYDAYASSGTHPNDATSRSSTCGLSSTRADRNWSSSTPPLAMHRWYDAPPTPQTRPVLGHPAGVERVRAWERDRRVRAGRGVDADDFLLCSAVDMVERDARAVGGPPGRERDGVRARQGA